MPVPSQVNGSFHFGPFHVDPRAGQLRKGDAKLRLSGQPFEILVMLLEKPGDVVTRDEIQHRLWPSETFVDFENSLNKAINKLRQALSDSADQPVYIETLPRRGYRFIGTLLSPPSSREVVHAAPPGIKDSIPEEKSQLTTAARSRFVPWRLTALAIFVALLVFVWFSSRSLPPPRAIRTMPLTDSSRVDLYGGLHSDGVRLYFLIRRGHRWDLSEMSASGGEVHPISLPAFTNTRILDISPDGSQFVIAPFEVRTPTTPIWLVPAVGGTPHRLGDFVVNDAKFSPNGSRIAFSDADGISEVGLDGQNLRRILTLPGSKWGLVWSPDGSRLRFYWVSPPDDHSHIWEVRSDGSQFHRFLPNWTEADGTCCGHWTANGKYFLFLATGPRMLSSVWAVREPYGLFHRQDPPFRLTTDPLSISNVIPASDDKRLFVLGNNSRIEYVRADPQSHQIHGLLGGLGAVYTRISPSGDWAVFKAPGNALWRGNLDGSSRLQLAAPRMQAAVPAISPDGKSVAFRGQPSTAPSPRIYIVPSSGGDSIEVASSSFPLDVPAWSPNAKALSYYLDADENPASGIYLLDLSTHASQKIPGTEKCWKHAWSPDGRYLSCVSSNNDAVFLLELSTHKLISVARGKVFSPISWSSDSSSLFYQDLLEEGEPVRCFHVKDRSVERVFECAPLLEGGVQRCGFEGLSPDGLLVIQLTRGDHDIYSIDVDLP